MMPRLRALCFFALFLPVLYASAAEEQRKPLSLEERVARLERLTEGQSEIVLRIEAMQRDLQRLQGEIEEQGHGLGGLKQGQLNALRDFDRRLSEIEKRLAPPSSASAADSPAESADSDIESTIAPPPPAAPSSSPAKPAATPAAPAASAEEEAAYQQAFTLLKEAHYDKAVAAFRDYLKRYPNGANADKAQYWLGETYYVTRRFKESLQAFQTVLERYPGNAKQPDAALKIGFVHYETGAWNEARKALNEVVKNYPDTPAAKLAGDRLQRMKKEGR